MEEVNDDEVEAFTVYARSTMPIEFRTDWDKARLQQELEPAWKVVVKDDKGRLQGTPETRRYWTYALEIDAVAEAKRKPVTPSEPEFRGVSVKVQVRDREKTIEVPKDIKFQDMYKRIEDEFNHHEEKCIMVVRDDQRWLRELGYDVHEGWLYTLASTKLLEEPEKEYHTPPEERRPRRVVSVSYAEPEIVTRKPSEKETFRGTTGTSGISSWFPCWGMVWVLGAGRASCHSHCPTPRREGGGFMYVVHKRYQVSCIQEASRISARVGFAHDAITGFPSSPIDFTQDGFQGGFGCELRTGNGLGRG
jgi:hypothetical protein